MIDSMILDADMCIKLGGSEEYRFLYELIPLIAQKTFMHTHAFSEVKMPSSAVNQLKDLVSENKIQLVDENDLNAMERAVFDASYSILAQVMIDQRHPNKNKGETCSLAYAKATGIPYFATDEKDLQPIIDKRLNTGTDDITCLRIIDIIQMARKGEIDIKRKICKVLWVIAGKDKDLFNKKAWPKDLND